MKVQFDPAYLLRSTRKSNLIDHFRSLAFGGTLGFALAILLYFWFPNIGEHITVDRFAPLGGLIGSIAHKFIEKAFIQPFLLPAYKFSTYYFKVAELHMNWRNGLISDQDYIQMKRVLDYEYFIDENHRLKN